jgi:hypothetical protein
MTTPEPAPTGRHTFRRTLLHVLLVQAVALLLLWLLQARYPAG